MISVIVAVFASCGHQTKLTDTTDEILMQVGDSTLTRSQVIQQIPSGLDIADSVRLFDAIVENWLEKYMLSEVARLNIPDIDRIENMVQEYRRQLLSNEYRRVMAQERVKNLPIDSVKAYYDAHIDEFVLAEPIVRGIYIKLPANTPRLADIRKLMVKATPEAIDELEKFGLHGAMQYDYFSDTWVGWSEIANQIPCRFGDADQFVSTHKDFEFTDHGTTYLLHISEALGRGETIPFEYAENEVRELLSERRLEDFDSQLLNNLYARGLKDKIIRKGKYIPLKYRDKTTPSKNTINKSK